MEERWGGERSCSRSEAGTKLGDQVEFVESNEFSRN